MPTWIPVNWGLIGNPINWVIVILMLSIGAIAVSIVVGGLATKSGVSQ